MKEADLTYLLPGRAWERISGGCASNLSQPQTRQSLAYIGSQAEPWNHLILLGN
jgi:hypothetical protein